MRTLGYLVSVAVLLAGMAAAIYTVEAFAKAAGDFSADHRLAPPD